MILSFPEGAALGVREFEIWNQPPRDYVGTIDVGVVRPVLTGTAEISSATIYLTVDHVAGLTSPSFVVAGVGSVSAIGGKSIEAEALAGIDLAKAFGARSAQVEAIAGTLKIDTQDEYVNAAGGAIGIAAETLWDQNQECVLHGGVAWRTKLAGWRGPYNLDALGNHDRAVQEFRHWLKRQNVTSVTTADPAVGPWDANIHLARKEGLLHSNGDLSNNHYDMNLVFFDVLLRHLMWTGDLGPAREVWPALQRHLAWEHRLFRRTLRGRGR